MHNCYSPLKSYLVGSELLEEYRFYSKEVKQLKKRLESLEEEGKKQVQTLGLIR